MKNSSRVSLLVLSVVFFMATNGCKPSTEPEYPYERQPLQIISAEVALPLEGTETHLTEPPNILSASGDSLQPEKISEKIPTGGEPAEVVETAVVIEPAVEEPQWPLETFHEARGKVIQTRDEPGQHEFRFHPSGFFNYRYAGDNEGEVKRRGTYQLEGDSLLLHYTETRSKTGLAAREILRGQSVELPVRLPGDGSLHLGSLRYIAIN